MPDIEMLLAKWPDTNTQSLINIFKGINAGIRDDMMNCSMIQMHQKVLEMVKNCAPREYWFESMPLPANIPGDVQWLNKSGAKNAQDPWVIPEETLNNLRGTVAKYKDGDLILTQQQLLAMWGTAKALILLTLPPGSKI